MTSKTHMICDHPQTRPSSYGDRPRKYARHYPGAWREHTNSKIDSGAQVYVLPFA